MFNRSEDEKSPGNSTNLKHPNPSSPRPSQNNLPFSIQKYKQNTNLAFTSARKETQLQVKLPTKLNVLGLESFSATRAAWMTPHEYVVPTNQNVKILQAKMTTQP